MTGIKVIDRDSRGPHRRMRLWECLGRINVNPTEIKDAKGAYYVIVNQNQVEHIISDNTKQTLRDDGFEVLTPIEFNSLRTVVIKHIDRVINEYSNDEIVDSINTKNTWAEVEEIYKITNTGRLLKVKFKSTNMVRKALDEGMIILNQKIPPRQIEKEIYVKLTPCFNCYNYEHKTRDCEMEQKMLCGYCGNEGHKQINCSAQTPRCINCKGQHRTLAAVCPIRKTLIKNRMKEIRDRSKSRTRAQQQNQTYAEAARPQAQSEIKNLNIEPTQMKEMIAKIMTSIIYAQCIEVHSPGSFQDTMDTMLVLNNLPKVKFPAQQMSEGFRQLFRDTCSNLGATGEQTRQDTGLDIDDNEVQDFDNEITTQAESMIVQQGEYTKRDRDQRESLEPRTEIKKQKHETSTTGTIPKGLDKTQARQKTQKPESQGQAATSCWLKLYIKKSHGHLKDCATQEKRDKLRRIISEGGSKIHWKHPTSSYERIFTALVNGKLKLESDLFALVDDKEFPKIKHMNLETGQEYVPRK